MSETFALLLLQEAGSSGGSFLTSPLLPLLAVFVLMYFLLIRPQIKERQRTERETKEFRESLKNGDKVISSGGIYGTITSIRDDSVQLRIADGVKIEIARTAIAGKQPEPGQASENKS